MNQETAMQVARLLNERNQLTIQYTADKVLAHADNYLLHRTDDGAVLACVEVKKVQWYQAEVLHLTVAPGQEGRGLARALLQSAAKKAKDDGARVLQCTIRLDNNRSILLFESCGFSKVSAFFNQRSNNSVGVWQRVLSLPP